MTRTVHIVPHTHWDREWYRPFQTFRMQLVDLLDGLLPALERPTRPTPTSCSTGRWRWSTTTSRSGPRPSRCCAGWPRPGRISDGPLVHPHGRVPRLRRDDGPRPPARPRPGGRASAGPCRSATCPTCSATSPRCPSSSRQFGFDHTVVWRGVPAAVDRDRVLVGGARRDRGAGRLPRHRLQQRLGPARRRQGAGRPDRRVVPRAGRPLAGDPVLWMNGTDHLLPQAHGSAGWWPRPTTSRTTTTSRSPRWPHHVDVASRATERCRSGPASCGPAPGPTCSWAWRPTGSTCTRPSCAGRARARADRRAALGALPPGRPLAVPLPRRGLARGHPQLGPRLDLRLLGRRGGPGRHPPLRRGPHHRARA